MKKIFYFIITLLLSCTKKEANKTIELKILSPSIVCNKNLDSMRYSNKDFRKNQNNTVLRFKITNKTNQNYFLIIRNVFNTYNGINTKDGANLDLDFLQIVNSDNNDTVKINYACTLPMPNKKQLELFENNNRIKIQQFNNLNYFKSLDWINKNELISNNLLYLKSNEVKYFETFVNLPYSEASNGCSYVELNYKFKYTASLKFMTDTTNIKKYLTWSQLKNIEANNYQFYNGTIVSENALPIVFVEE